MMNCTVRTQTLPDRGSSRRESQFRHAKHEGCARAGPVEGLQMSGMCTRDLLCDRPQAVTSGFTIARWIDPVEAVEDAVQCLMRNSGTVVGNLENHLRRLVAKRH